MNEYIKRVNELFEGDLTEQDKLVYVNVIKGKLLESPWLKRQAANKTKAQFANSPDLNVELLYAIVGALETHNIMSTEALESKTVLNGLMDVLLGPAQLYETLRNRPRDQT
jgi:type I restriction enzyme R subunit